MLFELFFKPTEKQLPQHRQPDNTPPNSQEQTCDHPNNPKPKKRCGAFATQRHAPPRCNAKTFPPQNLPN